MKKIAALCIAVILLTVQTVSAAASCRVVTLMYHNITTDEARWDDWCVSPQQLEEDIKYFTDRGYITLTAGELAAESMENLDGKSILLITFDDGYEGWYTEAYPVLEKLQAKATMFVVGAYINRFGFLSAGQIHDMANCSLIEIGNHTDRVHQMPLDTLKVVYEDEADDVMADIKNNGIHLSDITGKENVSLAWPYGYFTPYHDRRVKNDLGYRITFSTNFGVNEYNGDLSHPFNRINRDFYLTSEKLFEMAEKEFNK